MRLRLLLATGVLLGALAPGAARAHFLWLSNDREAKEPVVLAFLSETPTPDSEEFLKYIEKAKVSANGKALPWTKGEDTFRVALPEPRPKVVDGDCDMGVRSGGKGEPYRLFYTARVQYGPAPADTAELDDSFRARLVDRPGKAPAVVLTFQGKPAPGSSVKVFGEDGKAVELTSDAEGRVEVPAALAAGQGGLLAKWVEPKAGEFGGKSYREVRYYATLTIASAKEAKAAPEAEAKPSAAAPAPDSSPFALLPEAVNSFGGAVLGDWLYVYSGHMGETHAYHDGTSSKHFRRLNLKDRTTWEELPHGPALQGLTLAAHGGLLYRIGGMAPRNHEGEPNDLVSVADFARFDPSSKTWTALPSMPSPRSTHDSVVVGDTLYVIGGWSMNGGNSSKATFCTDALSFNLAAEGSRWETLPTPPFRRRAFAVAEAGGKIYALGGLNEDNSVAKAVEVYDPASRTWSHGPDLPVKDRQGFAASAFGVGGELYVAGLDGKVSRLNASGDGWETVGPLAMPRSTHRLLPGPDKTLLVVGGTFATTPTRMVESFSLDKPTTGPKVVTWSVPVATEARQGQAVALVGPKLILAGGNRTDEPHAFDAENLLGDCIAVTVGSMKARPASLLPAPRQSATLVVDPDGRPGQGPAYLLGGIGPDGGVTRTLGTVFALDAKSGAWSKVPATIPDDRGMFGTAYHHGALWIFGGSIFDPRPGKASRPMPTDILRWDVAGKASTFESVGTSLPRARRSFAGTVLGSKYYLVGGLGEDREPVGTVDVFDFGTKAWSTIPSPKSPRLFASLVALDGKLYLAGGFSKGGSSHFAPARSIEVFDPATQTWSTTLETSPMPPGELHMLPVQGRLLLAAMADGPRDLRFALVAP